MGDHLSNIKCCKQPMFFVQYLSKALVIKTKIILKLNVHEKDPLHTYAEPPPLSARINPSHTRTTTQPTLAKTPLPTHKHNHPPI